MGLIRDFFDGFFDGIDIDDPELETEEEPKSIFSFFKNKEIKLYEKNEVVNKISEKKYISMNRAILLADKEKNMRKSMYIEAKRNGYYYGLIEINEYYATLVMFKGEYAWFIKVIDGKYVEKKGEKYKKGYYNEDSNVSCLVMAETGEYIYLGTDFDTRNFRMTTDDEFLDFIHNVRQ